MEQTATTGTEAPKRPTFLTVLCILTFIGSALGIIGAIWGYFTAQAASAMMSGFESGMEGNAMGEAMMNNPMMAEAKRALDNAMPTMIIGVICSILCLFGALQMWKLKKTGFYIYTAGELIQPIAGFILGGGGLIGGMGATIGLVFAIVWVVLYALNLKHLK